MTKVQALTLFFLSCSLLLRSQSDTISYKIKTGYLIAVSEIDDPGIKAQRSRQYRVMCGDYLFSTRKLEPKEYSSLKSIYENCEAFINNRYMTSHIILSDSSKLEKLTDAFFDSLTATKPVTSFEKREVWQIPVTIIFRNTTISLSSDHYYNMHSTSLSYSCFAGLDFVFNAVNVYQVEYMFSPY